MHLDVCKPIVLERIWASYISEDEPDGRQNIFKTLSHLGYLYRSETSEVTPEGKTKVVLEMVKQTLLSIYDRESQE